MRIVPKCAFLVAIGLVLVMGVSACGDTTSTGPTPSAPTITSTTAPTPTTTPTMTPTSTSTATRTPMPSMYTLTWNTGTAGFSNVNLTLTPIIPPKALSWKPSDYVQVKLAVGNFSFSTDDPVYKCLETVAATALPIVFAPEEEVISGFAAINDFLIAYQVCGQFVQTSPGYLASLGGIAAKELIFFRITGQKIVSRAANGQELTPSGAMPRIVNDTDPGIRYTSHWGVFYASPYYDGDHHNTMVAGESFSYTFIGTSVTLLTATNVANGTFNCYIDGNFATSINLYSASIHYQVKFLIASKLPLRQHTVSCVTTDNKFYDVDALLINYVTHGI